MKVVKVVNDFSGRIQVGIACAGPQICEIGFRPNSFPKPAGAGAGCPHLGAVLACLPLGYLRRAPGIPAARAGSQVRWWVVQLPSHSGSASPPSPTIGTVGLEGVNAVVIGGGGEYELVHAFVGHVNLGRIKRLDVNVAIHEVSPKLLQTCANLCSLSCEGTNLHTSGRPQFNLLLGIELVAVHLRYSSVVRCAAWASNGTMHEGNRSQKRTMPSPAGRLSGHGDSALQGRVWGRVFHCSPHYGG